MKQGKAARHKFASPRAVGRLKRRTEWADSVRQTSGWLPVVRQESIIANSSTSGRKRGSARMARAAGQNNTCSTPLHKLDCENVCLPARSRAASTSPSAVNEASTAKSSRLPASMAAPRRRAAALLEATALRRRACKRAWIVEPPRAEISAWHRRPSRRERWRTTSNLLRAPAHGRRDHPTTGALRASGRERRTPVPSARLHPGIAPPSLGRHRPPSAK